MDRAQPHDDDRIRVEDFEPLQTGRRPIRPTPFVWRDPKTMPRREWLYGRHLIRRYLSATFSPGAVGKSSLAIVEALAMVTGRPLLGISPVERLKVWYINLEDPLEETERRVIAACLHYDIDPSEIEGRLFLNSGRDTPLVIATETKDGVRIVEPVVVDLIASLKTDEIDVIVVDPFVSSHNVTENDNAAIDKVAKCWNRVAEAGGAAAELIHHVRKGQAGQSEFTVEDGRGAGALLAAVRSARVLNPMSKVQADDAGLDSPRGYFRADNGKANLAPPPDRSEWFHLVSVSLGNGPPGMIDHGDHVAVVTPWEWPDAFSGVEVADLHRAQQEVAGGQAAGARWRESVQANDWVGIPIARALRLDPADKTARHKIKRLLKTWIETGMFVVIEGETENRKKARFVEVGTWACAT